MMVLNNLLVITNNFPNVSDTYTANIFVKEQLKYIKKSFDKVYVISPVAYGMEYVRNTQFENYSFDNVHVYFPKYFNLPFFYKYGRDFWVKLEAHAIFKLLKKQNIKFDIIHAHFTWPSGAVAVELKKKLEVPVVITEHTSTTFQKAIDRQDPIFIHSWQMSDAVIRVRGSDISLMENVGVPLENIHHIPNGYDHKKFFALDKQLCREKLCLPTSTKIILNVGNLYSDIKGHFYLIESMKEVVSKRDDVLCFIVGDGVLRDKLETQISSSNLQNHVKIVGSKPHHEISLWMNACDLFVLPSLRESFGVVQIEAMACGKPVVATYNGGSEEIVISEDYGLLAEKENSNDLAEKIDFALDKIWNKEKIINYAEQYQWELICGQIQQIYERIL